jgi:hypothetical protein
MIQRLWRRSLGAALAFVLLGCGDDKPKDQASATVTATAGASAAPPADTSTAVASPLTDLTMPADVVAVAGIGDPVKVFDRLTTAANAIQAGGTPLGDEAMKLVADRYALQPTAVDRTKPIQVAVFDPKKNVLDPIVFIARVGSKDKLLAAVKGSPGADPGDGLITWGNVFARVEGDVAMMSRDKSLLATHAPFLKKLASAAPVEGMSIAVPMQHIGELYGKDIEALSSQIKMMSPPDQAASTEAMMGALNSALKELKTFSITLKPTEDGLFLDLAAEPTALSTWRAVFPMLGTKNEPKQTSKLPANSFFAVTAILPPESRPLVKKYFEWVGSMPGGSGMKGALQVYDKAWDAFSGEIAFAGFSQDGKAGVLAVSGVKDAQKVRDAQREAIAEMLKAPQTPEMKQLKIKFTSKKAAYKIGDVEVDTLKTEMENAPPGIGGLMSWAGETHTAVTATESVVAYGPSAKTVLEAYISGKLPGGLDASPFMSRVKRASVKDALLRIAASPNDIVTLAGLPVATKGAAPMTISAGASDGVLHFGLDLPTEQIPAIAVGFGALQSAVLESMQGGGGSIPTKPKGATPVLPGR